MDKPTLKSLSKTLNLHPSLISRVLRGSLDARVSDAKRQLILQVAKEAGYRPNRMGRSLRSRSSNVIALLTPDIANPYHLLFFRGAESAARTAGFEVMLSHVADVRQSSELMESVTGGWVDGVLVACAWEPDPRLEILKAAGMPYVVINRPSGNPEDVQFLPDDAAIGAMAARTLMGLGHQKVVAVFADIRLGGMRLRKEVFLREAHALNPGCEITVKENVSSFGTLRALVSEVMKMPDEARPSAIFLAHSQHAAAVIEEVTLRHKRKVPEDLTVLGCGTNPDTLISSVTIPAETIGAHGMAALLDIVAGNTPQGGALYPPVLNTGVTMAHWPPRR